MTLTINDIITNLCVEHRKWSQSNQLTGSQFCSVTSYDMLVSFTALIATSFAFQLQIQAKSNTLIIYS